jgi:hypothetical protein
MRKRTLIVAALLAVMVPAIAGAGAVVIYSDEWLFVDGLHANIGDQIARSFDRGMGGTFLDWTAYGYGPDGYYQGPVFTPGSGYTKTVISSAPTLAQMLLYDGIFLGLNGATDSVFKANLADYVRQDGRVFIVAGYDGNPAVDGAAWNDFLIQFDLAYGGLDWTHYYNNCQAQPNGQCSYAASQPLTGLPTGMIYDNGHQVYDLTPGETTYSRIIATMYTDSGPTAVGASWSTPEPGVFGLVATGLAALAWRRLRRSN